MSNMRGRGRGRGRWEKEEEEVEELLQEAQDDVLLRLTLNSHLARSSSSTSSLDQDLLRRFEALKLPSDSSKSTSVPPPSTKPKQKPKDDCDYGVVNDDLGDDLLARFSALRNSSSSSCSSTTTRIESCKKERFEINDEDDEEHEVSKVIQWAIDEARLNPSSFPSDHEDDDDDEDETLDDRKTKPSK